MEKTKDKASGRKAVRVESIGTGRSGKPEVIYLTQEQATYFASRNPRPTASTLGWRIVNE